MFRMNTRVLFSVTRFLLCFCLSGALATHTAQADSISVSPTKIEVPGYQKSTTMKVKASGGDGSVVQVRIFGWDESRPVTELTRTNDVIVSPPMTRLAPRQEMTLRILKTTDTVPKRRECYRVLIDLLPNRPRRPGEVSVLIRHAVPVCFDG